MKHNQFDSDDSSLFDIATHVPGPSGSLPLTAEMLRIGRPATSSAGRRTPAWAGPAAALGGREFLILSTHGGIRAPDGTPIALGYHTGHWEVGLLMEAAAHEFKAAGAIPFAAPAPIRATAARRARRRCSTASPIATMRRQSSAG